MEKKTVKAVTRKQKFLAAIAGDGVAPHPITSDEKLMYNIAEKTNEGGDSTGGGSSGGVLVVHDVLGTLDKTWQEIANAVATTGAAIVHDNDGAIVAAFSVTGAAFNLTKEKYYVLVGADSYGCASASGYPKLAGDPSGPMA